jgi:acetyl esterase/lipase
MTARIRRWSTLFAVILVTVFATQTAAVADGQRYRDEVFTSTVVTSDIAYGQAPDENGQPVTLRLDLYQPDGDTEPARPAFVWIHGGGFSAGNKADALEALIGERFAKRGYVVASINYRMREGEYYSFGVGDPRLPEVIAAAQHDAQAAVRWLRANAAAYRIDAARIAVGGFSAGGVAALYVNYNSSDPGESGNAGYPSNTSACVDVSGDMDVSLMEAGEPPELVVHGTADTTVPYSGALDIVARAQEVGVTAEFHPIEGTGHVVWFGDAEEIIGWMSDFLYRYVAPQPSVDDASKSSDAAASDDGDSKARLIVLAGVAAALVVLVAGAWYVRRRLPEIARRFIRARLART